MSESQAIKNIKKARKAKGWTQEYIANKIAERLGQSYSLRQYQKLEAGEFPKYKEKIVTAIEELLEIKISHLIYGNKVQESHSPSYFPETSQFSELIYVAAARQAKYPTHFQDPTFIKNLPKATLPGITYRGEQYRIFEVTGNTVTPYFKQGDWLICKKTELHLLAEITEYTLHVVIREADILAGWLAIKDDEHLVIKLQNENFSTQILLPTKDIKELWHVENIAQTADPVIKKFNINIK